MKHEIKTKEAYHDAMMTIYHLAKKEDNGLSSAEQKKLSVLIDAAEKYQLEILCVTPKKVEKPLKYGYPEVAFINELPHYLSAFRMALNELRLKLRRAWLKLGGIA